MSNDFDEVDDLILQSLVQGELEIPGKVIDSIFNREPKQHVSERDSHAMLERLLVFAKRRQYIKNKLENPNLLNHFGEYLSIYMLAYGLSCKELAQRGEAKEVNISGLEKGKLPPTAIAIEEMVSLIKQVKLRWESARTLL